VGVVLAAIAVWVALLATFVMIDYETHHRYAPAPHTVNQSLSPEQLKGIADIVAASHKGTAEVMAASHQNLPLLIICASAVLIFGIIAWMRVRMDRNRYEAMRYQYSDPRLQGPGDLTAQGGGPFADWSQKRIPPPQDGRS